MVAYLPAARDPEIHVQNMVRGRRLPNDVLWQRVENYHGGLGEEIKKEAETLAMLSLVFVDGAHEYLSGAKGTAPLALAVQPLK